MDKIDFINEENKEQLIGSKQVLGFRCAITHINLDGSGYCVFELEATANEILKAQLKKSTSDLPDWAVELFDLVTGTKILGEVPILVGKVNDKKALKDL